MPEARIFITDSWNGPARRDGTAYWILEYTKDGEPKTREGFIHLEAGTQTQGVLMALVNAFHVLDALERKNILESLQDVKAYTNCPHVSATVQNGWHLQWRENGWKNARGDPVRNAALWEMLDQKSAGRAWTAETGRHEYTSVMRDAVKKELREWKRRKENAEKP